MYRIQRRTRPDRSPKRFRRCRQLVVASTLAALPDATTTNSAATSLTRIHTLHHRSMHTPSSKSERLRVRGCVERFHSYRSSFLSLSAPFHSLSLLILGVVLLARRAQQTPLSRCASSLALAAHQLSSAIALTDRAHQSRSSHARTLTLCHRSTHQS